MELFEFLTDLFKFGYDVVERVIYASLEPVF